MKIGAIYPMSYDATSLYRGAGPMTLLAKTTDIDDISATYMEMDWDKIWRYDLFFMQRPQTDYDMHFISTCKKYGKPVIADYDDNLIEVPSYHPMSWIYNDPARRQRIVDIISMVSGVIVSTEGLYNTYSLFNDNVTIIRNAWDNRIGIPSYKEKEKLKIVWRGSRTHTPDVYEYLDQFLELFEAYPDAEFHFMGDVFSLFRHHKNVHFHAPMGIIPYFQFLKELNPSIIVVPLINSIFNLGKSSISLLEANYAGAICVCPKWGDFYDATYAYEDGDLLPAIKLATECVSIKGWEGQNVGLIDRTVQNTNIQRLDYFKTWL